MSFDMRLALMTGIDIPIPECQLVIHQPTMKEIAFIGEQDFFIASQTICVDKNMISEDKRVLDEISNFHIFMTVIGEEQMKDKKEAVKQFLSLVFPNYTVMFTPRSLVFRPVEGEMITIDESNFEFIQNTISRMFCFDTAKKDEIVYNPGTKKAKEIADKIMQGRKKVAELKSAENVSVFSQYLSSLCVGLHIPLTELCNLTVYQMYDLLERFSLFTNWDVDLRCRLAGGSPDSQPDNWMKNIH